ncbi:MAG: hypothetical protein ACAI38_01520 [Myxococcota bacterium]
MTVAFLMLALAAAEESESVPATEVSPPQSPNPISGTAKQDAVFSRPFMIGGANASLGGYTEFSLNYARTDGIDEGPSFEFQRFNLFVYSPITRFIRFVAEVEFEHGTEEIKLETATVDIEAMPELVFRAGIILTPIGAFNQAHDGPLWDFVERPLVSTTIIPATFSEVGAGAHGTVLVGPLDLDYQAYVTQGLGDGVLDNPLGRTSIPAGRGNELFAEDNNRSPAFTGRAALRYRRLGELGLSAYYGAFNTYVVDGLRIDSRRDLLIAAVDYRLSLQWLEVRGEAAHASIDVPASLRSTFGNRQWGTHTDVIAPVWRFAALGYDATQIEVGARLEYVDYNVGELPATATSAAQDVTRVTGSVAWRWSASTVLRVNYGYAWERDLVRSATARTGTGRIGFATYF